MKKLPFIRDKKLYAAVMGACRYVRDTGFFNKATSYYADRYGVDVEDVKRYVRLAQSSGQKQENANKKRKYYYFAVEYSFGSERGGCDYFDIAFAEYQVVKATCEKNATWQLCKGDNVCSEYAPVHHFGRIKRFDDSKAAIACIDGWKSEKKKRDGENPEKECKLCEHHGKCSSLRKFACKGVVGMEVVKK